MTDILVTALILIFFGLSGAYLLGLDRLWRKP